MLLKKIDGGHIGIPGAPVTSEIGRSVKTLRLVILGQNELFGLDEIIEDKKTRTVTVECSSKHGKCYFITRENFIHCVNLFKFQQQVIEEKIVKYELYCNRMIQTHEFMQQYAKK